MTGSDISDRARFLLKTLVERHIQDGQPVGSRTLMEEAGLPVSAATIRNVMSDLEERGLLHSPHTSAGRVPTALGYRLFVDSLLQVKPLEQEALSVLRAELNPDKSTTELVQSASSLLATISSQAGLVTVPRQETNQLRQVEFLPLSGDRVLVILVINEREVQNRIIHTQRVFTEEELREAAAVVKVVRQVIRVHEPAAITRCLERVQRMQVLARQQRDDHLRLDVGAGIEQDVRFDDF